MAHRRSRAEAQRAQLRGRRHDRRGGAGGLSKDRRTAGAARPAFGRIGEKAEVKVSDDEVGQALAQRARAFPGQEKAVWEYYRKNPRALAETRAPIYEEKVVDYVISEVKLTDKKVSKDELFKVSSEDADDTIAETVPGTIPE